VGSRSLKVIDVDKAKKPVTGAPTTCVSGVHSDKDPNTMVQRYLRVLKSEHGSIHCERVLDGRELRRNHGKDRNVDPVEFVKAAPGTALTEARKDFTHHFVVHSFTTVCHDAQQTQCLQPASSSCSSSSSNSSCW